MIEQLQALCALNGVTGCEDSVRDYIRSQLTEVDAEITTDAIGNLTVFKKGKKRARSKLLICAHMDEVGFIIKSVAEEGYLKFACVGGIDRRVLPGKMVSVGEHKLPGVIGIKAVHLTTADERKSPPRIKDLYIDIGASDKKSAAKLVSPGDFAAFVSDIRLTKDTLRAKAIDDRVGCAIMLELIKSELEYDTWFAFTAQEEVGTRGAASAAYAIAPDIALILETTTAADLPDVKGMAAVSRLNRGVVLSYADNGTLYDRALFEQMRALAEQNKIGWQLKSLTAGGTDAGRIHLSRCGVRCAGLAVPVRYLHAANTVAALSDMDAMRRLSFLAAAALPETSPKGRILE